VVDGSAVQLEDASVKLKRRTRVMSVVALGAGLILCVSISFPDISDGSWKGQEENLHTTRMSIP
jgi:hypothetical protein